LFPDDEFSDVMGGELIALPGFSSQYREKKCWSAL
jgi:hypothetical protein